jgi:tRNA/rRNA methyltransferase
MSFVIDLCVVGIRGAINLGSLCRLMENYNVRQLHLVEPVFNRNEEKIAEFACRGYHHFLKRKEWDNFADLVAQDYHYVIGTTAKTGNERRAVSSAELDSLTDVFAVENRILLVFGRENKGLSTAELRYCDLTVHIPLDSPLPVMNLSHAAAVLLYEISKISGLRKLEFAAQSPATGVEIAAFLRNVDDFLHGFGYYKKKERAHHRHQFSELVRHKNLSTEELRFLQGFLRAYKNRDK